MSIRRDPNAAFASAAAPAHTKTPLRSVQTAGEFQGRCYGFAPPSTHFCMSSQMGSSASMIRLYILYRAS